MAFHFECETCLQLWADYGAATLGNGVKLVTKERIEAALEALRDHEAEAHPKRFAASE
jgi:hypothetical protein